MAETIDKKLPYAYRLKETDEKTAEGLDKIYEAVLGDKKDAIYSVMDYVSVSHGRRIENPDPDIWFEDHTQRIEYDRVTVYAGPNTSINFEHDVPEKGRDYRSAEILIGSQLTRSAYDTKIELYMSNVKASIEDIRRCLMVYEYVLKEKFRLRDKHKYNPKLDELADLILKTLFELQYGKTIDINYADYLSPKVIEKIEEDCRKQFARQESASLAEPSIRSQKNTRLARMTDFMKGFKHARIGHKEKADPDIEKE